MQQDRAKGSHLVAEYVFTQGIIITIKCVTISQPNICHHEIKILDVMTEQTDDENMWKLEQSEHKVCDIYLLFWVLQLMMSVV
jgi:hypothetical protein